MGQRVEGKLAAHDRYHFELKLGYTLNPTVSTNKYNLEIYFFIPKSLGMNRTSYDKKDFFGNLQSYIRFKTPTFSFDNLTDVNNQLSPLTRIKKLLDTTCDRKKLIAELKLYACTVRVALRNNVQAMRKCIRKDERETLEPLLASTCSGLSNCLTSFRDIRPKFWLPSVDEDVRTAFRHVDEFLGIAIDGLLNSLHNAIVDSSLDESFKNELNGIITPLISAEFEYRKTHNYAVYAIEGENELFLYRKGILKKIVTSILFLDTYTHEAGTIIKDIIFAAAAGLAMVIFVTVSFWAGQRWSSTSLPFAFALVIGYVVKDRIKDWFKLIFSRKMLRWFSDYKTRIKDTATDDKIGVCRHVFSFLYEKSVPHEVMTLRRQNTPADFWLPEDVIKYEKEVMLKPRSILKSHARMRDVTDIIRFNVHRFLEQMDEPYEFRRALDPKDGKNIEFKCARVYHINLVLRLENELRRIRLILNQNGLKKIEEVK